MVRRWIFVCIAVEVHKWAYMIQTVLAFDFGLRSTGVAVGNTITGVATPLTTVARKKGEMVWSQIDVLVAQWGPHACVVGLSLNMDGSVQSFHPQLKGFFHQLERRYNIPVFWSDERLSTVRAKEHLFEKGGKKALTKAHIDAESACIILEQWLWTYQQENTEG